MTVKGKHKDIMPLIIASMDQNKAIRELLFQCVDAYIMHFADARDERYERISDLIDKLLND